MDQYMSPQLENQLLPLPEQLPLDGECLPCFVHRMLNRECVGLKWTTAYRDARAPRATAIERKFAELGGHCDCEVIANVYRRTPEKWMLPTPHEVRATPSPACLRVRKGCIRPCALWVKREGVQWGRPHAKRAD
ncbi:DUF2695 domain-containing protein [Paeniglutamicibacter cryotolerans]|uniref:DUF2695 domain-containing protein n=1 Tax=Paeniglutamicibacter cryotolerans TaxID=670079 RepID=A0A839QEV9_9MICC|nr:DUF2695 domain-containing protein [Paeniglutamicibacter cryotolerans]MBB2994808.1 hypothetical protein [Paeniglutamicibacter cryotolerans]